jgi:exosortase
MAKSAAAPSLWGAVVLTLIATLWAYAPTLATLAQTWSAKPEYSHGYLVPIFAGILLFLRAESAKDVRLGLFALGAPILALAVVLRVVGAWRNFDFAEAVSFVGVLTGLVALFTGWRGLRWMWPALAFLLFMVPLPNALETTLAGTLQRIATIASNYTLQTLGYPAYAEGNVITLNASQLGVAEACSGLSMLMIFLALSTAVAIVIQRPLLDRLIVLASAVPVAIIANVTRIVATGILYESAGKYWGDLVFHDLAGWLMMPLALALLGIELWLINLVLVPIPEVPTVRTLIRQRR